MTSQDELTIKQRQIEGLAREHLDATDADYYLSLLRLVLAVRMEHSDHAVGDSLNRLR